MNETHFPISVGNVTMTEKEGEIKAKKLEPHEMHNSELVSKLMGEFSKF